MIARNQPLTRAGNEPRPTPRAPAGAPLASGLAPAPHPPAAWSGFQEPQRAPFHQALAHAQQRVAETHKANVHLWSTPAKQQLYRDEHPAPTVGNTIPGFGKVVGSSSRTPLLDALNQTTARAARGLLAAQYAQHAYEVAKQRQQSGAGGALDLGFVNLTPLASAAAHLKIPGLGGVVGKVGNELLDLPGQAFLSGAMAGNAGAQAIGGRPQALEQLGGSIGHQVTHPVQSFEQAPLATALLFAGGENALGSLAGKIGRLGEKVDPLTGEVARAGLVPAFSRSRPDLQLYGDLSKVQRYSNDPIRKAAQKLYEGTLPQLPGRLAQRDPFVAEGWRLKHNLTGGIVHPGRLDYEAGAMDAARRTIVKQNAVPHAEGLATKYGREAIPLFVERVLKNPDTAMMDLRARIRDLEGRAPDLRKAEQTKNASEVSRLKALRDELDKHPEGVAEAHTAANKAIVMQRPLTAYEVATGTLRPEQVARAQLTHYAVHHMQAEHMPADASRVNPELAAAHESAAAEHITATGRVTAAENAVRQAERQHARAVGEARRAPQNRPPSRMTPAERRAAEGGGTIVDAAGGRLHGAREALAGAREAERAARDKLAANPRPVPQPGLRGPGGEHLPNEAIEAHMLEHGVPEHNGRPLVGFISHQEGAAGPGSFYRSVLRPPTLHSHTRTGESFRKGLTEQSFEGLVAQLARQASTVAQHEGWHNIVNKLVLGHYDTPEQARLAAENFNHPEAIEPAAQRGQQLGGMVPLNKGSRQLVDAMTTHEPRDVQTELARLGLEQHTPAHLAENAGKYGLIPRDVWGRLLKHQEAVTARGGGKRLMQAYTQAFRHAKFATSPKHAAGVTEESIIRPLAGMDWRGPAGLVADNRVGAAFLKQMGHLAQMDKHSQLFDIGPEAEGFRQAQGYLSGRGIVGSMKQQDIVRKASRWDETSAMAQGAELVGRSVPMKAWIRWRNFTEKGLEGIAHQSRTTVLGQELRRSGFVPSATRFLTAQDKAQQDLARGIAISPNTADYLARQLNDAAGNWSHLTPTVKAAVSTLTPFGLWWLNSMRWLYRLPVTQPIKTGLAAGIYQATRAARNAEGQGYDAPGAGTKAHPNYLQGTIPTSLPGLGPVQLDLGHYSPPGTLGPEAPSTAAEQIAPQLEGIATGLLGENALTREKLTDAKGNELGPWARTLNASSELLSGPLPGATQAQQLMQHGGKPIGSANLLTEVAHLLGGPSQVKPGPSAPIDQTLLKLINPLKTYKKRGGSAGVTPEQAIEMQMQGGGSVSPAAQQAQEAAIERAMAGH